MMREQRLTTFLCTLVLALAGGPLVARAQGPEVPKAILVAQYDPGSGDPDAFDVQAKIFLKMLAAAPKGTMGRINLYENDRLTKRLSSLAGQDVGIRKRVQFLVPGERYRESWTGIEFWLVPEGAREPFNGEILRDCPSIQITGPKFYFVSTRSVAYRATISGGAKVTFIWSVAGGKIMRGQRTGTIVIKPVTGEKISAAVEVAGLDPAWNCNTMATAETIYSDN